MQPKAVLFGSVGTLVETSDTQRRAFNIAFKDAGLDWIWDAPLYKDLLQITGGKARIAAFAKERGLVVDVDHLHRRKNAIFADFIRTGGVHMRPGVLSVISAASAAAVPLGFASTTEPETITTILDGSGGLISPRMFAFVGDRTRVEAVKPAPDIYELALSELGLKPQEVLAIEDTESSLAAPLALGIPTIAFPGAFASGNFEGALRVERALSPTAVGLGCVLRDYAAAS